jgi:hypothetical protein
MVAEVPIGGIRGFGWHLVPAAAHMSREAGSFPLQHPWRRIYKVAREEAAGV